MTASARKDLSTQAPAVGRAMTAFARQVDVATEAAGLDRRLVELLKVRVSQINRCAFCLDLHHREALTAGEEPRRLAVLPAWREAGSFTERERAALELCESITLLSGGQVSDECLARCAAVLDDDELAAVSWLAVLMNAYNRIAITGRLPIAPL